jgi:hypothetical protein
MDEMGSGQHRRADSSEGHLTASEPVIEVYKRHVDRTLIRDNLSRSIEERLEALTALQELAEELRRAGQRLRRSRRGD